MHLDRLGKKLTIRDVKAIKKAVRGGTQQQGVALAYGISKTAVSLIMSGKSWPHVPDTMSRTKQ
jgi:hypothetical protein